MTIAPNDRSAPAMTRETAVREKPPIRNVQRVRLVPCSVKRALALVRQWHRHLPELQGGLFAVAIAVGGDVRGVGIVGNPPPEWQDTGRCVISRVAVDAVANACSQIYRSLARAAKALGYSEVWTYTLPDEPGTSLRAAGFIDDGLTDGGEWTRPSRSRAKVKHPERKRRWVIRFAAATPTTFRRVEA